MNRLRLLGCLVFASFIALSFGKPNRFLKASNLFMNPPAGPPGLGNGNPGLDPVTLISILADKIVLLAETMPADSIPEYVHELVDSIKTFRTELEDAAFESSTQGAQSPEQEEPEEEEEEEAMYKGRLRLGPSRRNHKAKLLKMLERILEELEEQAEDLPADHPIHQEIQALQDAINILDPESSEETEDEPEQDAGGTFAPSSAEAQEPAAENQAAYKRALSLELRTLLNKLKVEH